MKLTRRTLALAAACAFTTATAWAQGPQWPSKPVKMIVNFPPGGAADQIGRAIAQPLQDALGQPVIVENRGGSGGNLGGEAVAKAPADGYTLLMSSGGMVAVNPHIYPKMSFDPAKDLTPVAAAARVLVFLVVRADSPIKDYKGFIADLKANPGKRSYGSPGNGSSPHLAAEMLKSQAGVFATHVPYRGAAPALTDLLGGQVDFLFDPGVAIPHIKAGKVRVLAVGSPQRSPLFPEVATLDELGLKGFNADSYFGLYAPAGTPAEVVARLNAAINQALQAPEVVQQMAGEGATPMPGTPQAFGALIAREIPRWREVIRAGNVHPD